jgi:hypothetical protein
MKVKDLIEALKDMSPETEVHFSYNCGGHWATQVAPAVESVSIETVQYSDYNRMDCIVDEEKLHQDEGDYNVPVRRVVVIS